MSEVVEGAYRERLAPLMAWIDGIALPIFLVRRTDHGMRFLGCNSTLIDKTNCKPGTFDDQDVFDVFPQRLARSLVAKYQTGFEANGPVSYDEIISLDGQDTFWRTTLSKPNGFDGEVLMGVAVPNTEVKRSEFATAEAMADMAERFDDLKLFSAMAAHDARSPLATVSSLIDIIKEDFVDFGDGKLALLNLIQDTVAEALTQISTTLERAHAMSLGKTSEAEVDLALLVGDIAAMVDPEERLKITLPGGRIKTDTVLLQMALRNLMANAARYCETAIQIRLAVDHGGGGLTFFVSDDGPGVGAGTTIRDLTDARRAADPTHGYGLASIVKLAASRGGQVEIDTSGQTEDLPGAVFRLTLPGRCLSTQDLSSPFAAE